MENKNEAVIANYIEKMMGERRQKIFESDEYIQQDNGDLDYLEERLQQSENTLCDQKSRR